MSAIEYTGQIVEMGDLSSGKRGILMAIRPDIFIEINGFARHDVMAMPNLVYKKVKITIEAEA